MKPRSHAARRALDGFVKGLCASSAAVGIVFLAWILYEVFARGIGALRPSFFTALPAPPGIAGGGLANAITGTLLMTGLATLMAVPLGMLPGIYMPEFGRRARFASFVRFVSDVLMGTPSIIIGVFVYALLVIPMRKFSGLAGAPALAILMLPLVARTTEEMLRLVPNELRESGLALGAPRWRVTLQVILRSARGGLDTGVLLAVARVSGETAPLLFTALNSPYWMRSLAEPTANLTVTVFNYAMSPYEDWQQMAWGASLLITAGVLMTTILVRFAFPAGKARV